MWFALYFSSKILREHLHEIITCEAPTSVDANSKVENSVSDHTVDLNTFAPSVVSGFRQICKNVYNTPGSVPEHPPCELLYSTSVFAIKNTRRKMEDRHVIVPNLRLLYPLLEVRS